MRLLYLMSTSLVLAVPVAAQAQEPANSPVVLELFTSQGCSSCPPADALLGELAKQDGVVALALHVDYWDYLGWKDSFGSPAHTSRQRAYAKAAHSRSIFTPEMVVQGAIRLKGHDAKRISAQIARLRERPPLVDLDISREAETLVIRIAAAAEIDGPADVHVVRFIPSETVEIDAGENAGRRIDYANIVTEWQTIARWDGDAPLDLAFELGASNEPIAVIVQRAPIGTVLTAAQFP